MMSSGEKPRAEWIFILNTPYKALLKQWKWRRLTKQIPINGIITSICVSNEELVEVEQPLFSVQEDKDND
ncbi:hypothetical protein Lreu23DRAFT_3838 [Limosilactobacillus reuteri subsp. rodentium]|uniref:Uncharacterized protein n=1 Tax=Limosilactobacillus reuteri subsp. rodentium (strain DSM 17509 / CIP 109821 / 100-23) TaxID=349123 RepID=B3XLG1_LIMR1|nr:hypothetical protein Lreu23DRAFT_3838 [Limosilactobacillus reuteri subsp. rodentium]